MKHTILIFLSLVSTTAFAIQEDACPHAFSVEYTQFIPASEESFRRQIRNKPESDIKAFEEVRDSLANGIFTPAKPLNFEYTQNSGGQCLYEIRKSPTQNSTRLYQRGGKTFLAVHLLVRKHEVTIRHEVLTYNSDSLEIEPRAALPLLMSAGESKFKLGWAIGFHQLL